MSSDNVDCDNVDSKVEDGNIHPEITDIVKDTLVDSVTPFIDELIVLVMTCMRQLSLIYPQYLVSHSSSLMLNIIL